MTDQTPRRGPAPALRRAEAVAAFTAILGRAPLPGREIQRCMAEPDLAALGATLLRHPEAAERIAALRLAGGAGLLAPPDAQAVREAYALVLRRPPESDSAIDLAMTHPSVLALLRTMLASEEYATASLQALWLDALRAHPDRRRPPPGAGRAPRVLVFGAFGNGNLGDAIQAEAVARLLPMLLGHADVAVAATSWLDRAPFPAEGLEAWPRETIMDGWKLAEFDLLVIGGGGMLAPVHFPLDQPAWARFVAQARLPVALLGIGVAAGAARNPAIVEAVAPLARGAVFATARAPRDLDALRRIHAEAGAFPDPVLACLALGLMPVPPRRPGARALLIVKRPVDAAEADFLEVAARLVAEHPDAVEAVAIEPKVDRAIAQHFPALRMITRFDALLEACAGARLVASARYHGCIAAAAAGAPTLGLGPEKCGGLLEGLGCPEAFIAAPALPGFVTGAVAPPRPPALDGVRAELRVAAAALRARLHAAGLAAAPEG